MRIGNAAAVLLLAIGFVHTFAIEEACSRDASIGRSLAEADQADQMGLCWPAHSATHETDEVRATFNDNGTFGAGFGTAPSAPSFEAPPGSDVEYLYGGAIWIGGVVAGDTLVSVGADGWQSTHEMFPSGWPSASMNEVECYGDLIVPYGDTFSFQSFRTTFTDTVTAGVDDDFSGRPHIPMNVELTLRSHSYEPMPVVWYDLIVTNIGDHSIEDAYIGLYVDADIGGGGDNICQVWPDDLAGSLQEYELAYIIDNDGNFYWIGCDSAPRPFAAKFLKTSFESQSANFNWWVSSADSSQDFGPRQKSNPCQFPGGGTGTPEGDIAKYCLMSYPEWDYDQAFTSTIAPDDPVWELPPSDTLADFSMGSDIKFLLSIGAFDLPPGSSERIIFATFTSDPIHTNPDNFDVHLPNDPEGFLSGLRLDRLVFAAQSAGSWLLLVGDPQFTPVLGLEARAYEHAGVSVRWDPWVLDGIDGYDLYVSEVPVELCPHPGVVPPWLEPDEYTLYGSYPPSAHTASVSGLNPDKFYFINAAHRTAEGVGRIGKPLVTRTNPRPAGPTPDSLYVCIRSGSPTCISWGLPDSMEVDHYNIYRFSDLEQASERYLPFYDKGCMSGQLSPKDSFYIPTDDETYYYYAIDPFVQVDGFYRSFEVPSPLDNEVFVITAVDEHGFESHFSNEVQLQAVSSATKDVLVVIDGIHSGDFVMANSVAEFYSNILDDYDFDFYYYDDSLRQYPDSGLKWRDFTAYRYLFIDGSLSDAIVNSRYTTKCNGFERYQSSGGRIVYFGALTDYMDFDHFRTPLTSEHLHVSWAGDGNCFAIDSVTFAGLAYCGQAGCDDHNLGFISAHSNCLPDLEFDTGCELFMSPFERLWLNPSGPVVATFKPASGGVVTHQYQSRHGEQAYQHGRPVGIWDPACSTYAFGFHLWYMKSDQARDLVESLLDTDSPIQAAPAAAPEIEAICGPDDEQWTIFIDPVLCAEYYLIYRDGEWADSILGTAYPVPRDEDSSSYTVVAGNRVGTTAHSDPVLLPSDVREIGGEQLPLSYRLLPNYPNPFNSATHIEFDLPRAGRVTLRIYNILGQEVATLVDEHLSAGRKVVIWNGDNQAGRTVASGVYFYRLSTDNYAQTRKMMLLK